MFEGCEKLYASCENWDVARSQHNAGFNENAPSLITPKQWQK